MVKYPPLSPGDPKEIQRAFNNLPVEQQLDILLQARGKERLRYLFLSENPRKLVERLPELEIYVTVKEVGRSDAVDLISLTTHAQFQYLLDLDFWKKDRLDPEKVVRWMEILLECPEEKVVRFIESSEPDFLALLLFKFIHVRKVEEFTEVPDRNLLFTLDREYFVRFNRAEDRIIFRPFLETLYHADSNRYRLLLESLTRELESNLEEEAYRFRNARMADYGFPDFEQALEIYQFLDPHTVQVPDPTAPAITEEEESEKARPAFYLASRGEGPFFSFILSKMTDRTEQSRLQEELAALCNKAMVAEPIDLFEIGDMEQILKRVFHYLDLGLQWLSREDEGKALQILHALTLQKIFQSGVGVTLLLRKRADALLRSPWFRGDHRKLRLLDPIHHEKMEGLLKRRPRIVRKGVLEDFRNRQDVSEAESFLDLIDAALDALDKKLKMNPEKLEKLDLTGCAPADRHELTLSTLFLTSLANRVLKGVFLVEAIEQSRLQDLFTRLFVRDEQGKGNVKMEIRHDLEESFRWIERDKEKGEHLLAFWDFCLDLLKTEYGAIPPGEEIDPRFVKGLILRTSDVGG